MERALPAMPTPDLHPRRRCPVCDVAAARHVHTQRFSGVGASSLLTGYKVVVCDGCGLGYADEIPDQAEFDRYYEERSKYEYGHAGGRESAIDLGRFRECADRFEQWQPDRSLKIVDIGCATGGLLAELSRRGYAELLGIDPSPQCVSAVDRLYGLRAVVGSLGRLPVVEPKADVVIFSCVLEHVRDLRTMLESVRPLLKDDGALFLEVPNAWGFSACRNAPYQQFSNEHINFFSPVSLSNLLRTLGAKPEQVAEAWYEWKQGVLEPIVSGLFRLSPHERSLPLEPDRRTREQLELYLDACRRADLQVRQRIDALADSAEPVYVWGVGTSTQRLLSDSRLRKANIIAFVDSNIHYRGSKLEGRPVLSPEQVSETSVPILIASYTCYEEIVADIRERLKLPNRMISLFEVSEPCGATLN
ncbi:MAG: hypothetical protein C0483_01170 [Pirellula sp.]|nr:hypothetical protein [Pirellula sp.]